MKCEKINCNGILSLSKIIYKNGFEHLESWCKRCKQYKNLPHTKENVLLFSDVPIRKSKPLQEIEQQNRIIIKNGG